MAAREEQRRGRGVRAGTRDQLVFVGFKRSVLALDRDTGEVARDDDPLHTGYVSLLLDGDRLIVPASGHTYCMVPLTGRIR